MFPNFFHNLASHKNHIRTTLTLLDSHADATDSYILQCAKGQIPFLGHRDNQGISLQVASTRLSFHKNNSNNTHQSILISGSDESLLWVIGVAGSSSKNPGELFTCSTALKLTNALSKPSLKLSLSYYQPTTFLLCKINKPRMEEIGATIPFLSASHCEFYGAHCATTHDEPSFPAQFTHLLED